MTWKIKRKVGVASAEMPHHPSFSKRKSSGDNVSLRQLFIKLGASVESLIDATPFGVSTPEPWSPATDAKKALLSNPMSVLNTTASKTINALPPAVFFGGATEDGASWTLAPSKLLASIREGLANVAALEEALVSAPVAGQEPVDVVMVEPAVEAGVPGDAGCDAFVDLGADRWGNTARVANPIMEAVLEAKEIQSKIMALIGTFQLRAKGIIVTSDDCSVDCSIFSLPENPLQAWSPDSSSPSSSVPGSVPCDEDDFEDFPSVVTETPTDDWCITEDAKAVPTEVVTTKEDQQLPKVDDDQKVNAAFEALADDEDDWIMTD